VITPYVNNDSLINDGKKNNWSVGISTSPLIQLHKSGTPFFDFELDKWKLYYRGLLFELNTHYYVNDKISVSLNIGGGYSFYEDLKHSEGPRLMYPVDYPIKIDLYILSYGAGIMYDFYTINEKWKLFGTGNVSLYHSPYGKYEYCTHTEYNKDFIFLAMTANLGCGINYNISNYFSVYIKPNFTIELPVGKSGGIVGMFIYNPNIYFGINYKFNKNEKV